MAELKTKITDADVSDFINSLAITAQKKQDSFELIKIFQELTGCVPKMWGLSIIGFGQYHYKSAKSSQEGDWPLVGFSPRKAAISLYIYSGSIEQENMLPKLGKFTMGKGCIYIKKLTDINMDTLGNLIHYNIKFLQEKYKS